MFRTSAGGRLVESATNTPKIVSAVFNCKHITYIITIAFVHKFESLDQAPMLNGI